MNAQIARSSRRGSISRRTFAEASVRRGSAEAPSARSASASGPTKSHGIDAPLPERATSASGTTVVRCGTTRLGTCFFAGLFGSSTRSFPRFSRITIGLSGTARLARCFAFAFLFFFAFGFWTFFFAGAGGGGGGGGAGGGGGM